MEYENGFEVLSHRARVSRVARAGDEVFAEWILDKGISNEIPEKWVDFKQLIVDYCTGTGLDTCTGIKMNLLVILLRGCRMWQ